MSDLDLLRGLGDQIVPPPIEMLRETARRRTRRTTTATVVSAAAAVALVAGFVVLNVGGDDDKTPRPTGPPPVPTRPLTYAEASTIHYGDQTVTAPDDVAELDLTDDGVVVRTQDGGIWFTDGEDIDQIGTLGTPGPTTPDHPYGATWGYVVSDNTGSRVGWFEFPQPGQPEVVVYDTRSGAELARRALDIEPGSFALLAAVTERFAYWYDTGETVEDDVPLPQQRIELTTGIQSQVTREQFSADQPPVGTPRTMMISHAQGDEPVVYLVHDAIGWQFSISGKRVEPQGAQPMDARDGATNRRFTFTAPAGYPNTQITWLVQWLDDDTVVLVAEGEGDDDLLECKVSTRACVVARTVPADVVLPELETGS
jgi:hypothetical protein